MTTDRNTRRNRFLALIEERRAGKLAEDARNRQPFLADPEQLPPDQRPSIPEGIIPDPVDTREAPELDPERLNFGSFFGSGILENAAGAALPVLDQVQRGIDTFGGSLATTGARFIPGEQDIEKKLAEVREQRGGAAGFFNISGQAQEFAEAFRRADFPTLDLPGGGIDILPGSGEFKLLDTIGVKGALELAPDALLAIATGGTGTARAIATRGLKAATGADIAEGAARATLRVAKAPKKFWTAPATTAEVGARLGDVASPGMRQAIDSVPARYRNLVHEAAATVSRTKVSNPKDRLERAVLANMVNTARNESKIAEGTGRFLAETQQLRNAGADLRRLHVVDAAKGLGIEAGLLRVRDVGDPASSRLVFRSEFFGTLFKGEDLVSEPSKGVITLGPRQNPALEVFDANVGDFRALTPEELNYARTYQEAITEQGDLLREAGMLKDDTLIMPDTGELYVTRVLKEIDGAANETYGRASKFGLKPSVLKNRSFSNEEVVERILEDGFKYLAEDAAVLQHNARQIYRAINNRQLVNELEQIAKLNPERIRVGVTSQEATRVRAALTRLEKNPKAKIRPATIDKIGKTIGEDLVPEFQEILKISDETTRSERIASTRKMADRLIEQSRRPTKDEFVLAGEKVRRTELDKFFFGNESDAQFASRMLDLGESPVRDAIRAGGKVGDIFRVMRTGFDFGFWMIQGIPFLGRATTEAVTHPSRGLKLYKAYIQSFPVAMKAFDPNFKGASKLGLGKGEDFASTVMAKTFTRDEMDDMLVHGVQFSRASTDVFGFAERGAGALEDVPFIGQRLERTARPFERAFTTPGDFLRASYYKNMRAVAARSPDPERALRDLAATANKMTGALSSFELGISPTQQAIERMFLFFSPRYTRSSLALVHDVFTGGLQGAEARRALFGMAGFGVGSYVVVASLLDQEPVLDPTDSRFLTVDIDGDRIGIGSFWTSFTRLLARTGGQLTSEKGLREFKDVRQNSIMRWLRGRSAPVGGIGWDLVYQEDFLGDPLDSPARWAAHLGRNTLPLAVETAVVADPTRGGPAAVFSDAAGLRARPLTLWEQRREVRNEHARRTFGKEWDDLNGLQQDVLEGENEDLRTLNQATSRLRSTRGGNIDNRIGKWQEQRDRVEQRWVDAVKTGVELLGAGLLEPKQFLDVYLTPANAARRQSISELFDREGQWSDVAEYYATSDFGGPELPEDVAYLEYISTVLANENFEDPILGFNFDAKDEAEQDFRRKWGDEVFAYVQQRTQGRRESLGYQVPEIVSEYWNNRERFRFYWDGVEQSVIERRPDAAASSVLWKEYKQANRAMKIRMTEKGFPEYSPAVKQISDMISKVKRKLRERDRELDAWLFRWNIGGVNTLVHPDNEGDDVRFMLLDGRTNFAHFMDNQNRLQIDTF